MSERAGPALASSSRSRPESRERRREQLIRSTIECISRHGFAGTTLARVADGAGLARGIVNFHFRSKEALLADTLDYLSVEYANSWKSALEGAGRSPAERLRAMLMSDFEPAVCNRRKIAVWFAFWGETKSRPTYMKTCGAHDQHYHEVLRDLCAAVIEDGGYEGIDADDAATALSALTDGLWLDLLISPGRFTRERGRALTLTVLGGLFPAHFGAHAKTADPGDPA